MRKPGGIRYRKPGGLRYCKAGGMRHCMEGELKNLRIDRSKRRDEPSPWAIRWILAGIAIFILLGAARFIFGKLNAATEVDIVRVHAPVVSAGGEGNVILNATGYIIAAHKIQLASKVMGKVAWIGVEKGDKVKQGQVLVRLEDDEYRAQVMQAKGQLATLFPNLDDYSLPSHMRIRCGCANGGFAATVVAKNYLASPSWGVSNAVAASTTTTKIYFPYIVDGP